MLHVLLLLIFLLFSEKFKLKRKEEESSWVCLIIPVPGEKEAERCSQDVARSS